VSADWVRLNICLQTVAWVAAKEGVSLWVPVSMAQYSVYEALACSLMPPNTTCCTTDPHMTVCLPPFCKATTVVFPGTATRQWGVS